MQSIKVETNERKSAENCWWEPFEGDRQRLRDYLKGLAHDEQLLKFRQLPIQIALVLFLSDEWDWNQFPELEFPYDFQEKQDKALKATLDFIQRELCQFSRQSNYSDSDESSEGMLFYKYGGKSNEQLGYEAFAKGLLFCLPMHTGFEVHHLWQSDPTKLPYCLCPCGEKTHLRAWRNFFHIDLCKRELCKKGNKMAFAPSDFVDHFQKIRDNYHRIIEVYMTKIYESYHKDGIRHIAFEKMGDPAYRRTSKLLSEKNREYVIFWIG